jgi:hypothetical protein
MAPGSRALRRTDLRIAAATALALLGTAAAQAGGVMTTDCVYDLSGGYRHGSGGVSCVRVWRDGQANPYVIQVPQAQSDEDKTLAAEHERLWKARCHPVIQQDQYGVPRYRYSAPGCDLGKYE